MFHGKSNGELEEASAGPAVHCRLYDRGHADPLTSAHLSIPVQPGVKMRIGSDRVVARTTESTMRNLMNLSRGTVRARRSMANGQAQALFRRGAEGWNKSEVLAHGLKDAEPGTTGKAKAAAGVVRSAPSRALAKALPVESSI